MVCAALQAQELDIYDIDDFVDPRIFGAVAAPHGRINCPCDPFLVSRLMAGGVANYVDVLRVTDSGASFVHLATSYYRGPWQANWKVTQLNREGFGSDHPALRSNTSAATPQNKNTLQLARYLAVGPHGSPSIIRMEATFTFAQYRQAAPVNGQFTFASRHEHEFGFEGDIPWRLGRFPMITSLVYVGRSGVRDVSHPETEFAEQRVTFLQRAPRFSAGYWSFDTAVAVGSVNAGHWSDLMVQPSLHITSPTILNMRVNIRYAPQVGRLRPPIRGEKPRSETANQFAIFIDWALFARRFHH